MTDNSQTISNKYLELYANYVSIIKKQEGKDKIKYYLQMNIYGSEKGGDIATENVSENARIPISEKLYNQLSKRLNSSKAVIFAHLSAKGKLSLTLEERT